jgi:hypothetical protein
MAAGDQSDMVARLRRALPPWFGLDGDAPVFDAFLSGAASALTWLYGLYTFARQQVRVATSTGGWLELSAGDVSGDTLPRFAGETDAAYSRRIRLEPLRDRNTVVAIKKAVFDITGIEPDVYEGFDLFTNGAIDAPNLAYSAAGRWSSTSLPLCVFVAVTMHNNYGIPNRGGFDDAVGGLGSGNFSWADNSEIVGSGATQLDVINAVERVRPAGVNVYVRFVTFGAPEDPSNNVPA